MPATEHQHDVQCEELDLVPMRNNQDQQTHLGADEVFSLQTLVPAWNGVLCVSDTEMESFTELFLAANKSAGFEPKMAPNPATIAGASDTFKLRIQIKNRLSVLELSNAHIGPGGAAILAEHLKSANGRCMTEIRVDCNKLGDNGARAICQAISKDHHITVVSMEMNGITKDSCSVISRMLKRVPTVAKFHVGNNPLGDEGVSTLAAVLHDSTALGEIGLSATNMTSIGARAVADALLHNSSLTHILVNRNTLADEGVMALANAMDKRGMLRCIELAEVGLTPEGCKRLAEVYRSSHTLTRMVVGPNPFGDAGAKALAEALRENVCLTSVEMDRCEVTDEGARALQDAISANKESRVRTILLNENSVSSAMTQQLMKFGEQRRMKISVSSKGAARARPAQSAAAASAAPKLETRVQKKEDVKCCTTM
jgi:hypothetical protein